jgi:hypothetical protein
VDNEGIKSTPGKTSTKEKAGESPVADVPAENLKSQVPAPDRHLNDDDNIVKASVVKTQH